MQKLRDEKVFYKQLKIKHLRGVSEKLRMKPLFSGHPHLCNSILNV